ncbi:hypothetical protein EFL81_10205 [Weissella confusa]|uniref:hypothetical protein n=1 Tax=Weissella confusa TaxID=1583 RepID=UPI00223BC426|nr:hypothetical protein [Weissella confusa]MCS9997177.1 hypothetical protein [Weissella confusa]
MSKVEWRIRPMLKAMDLNKMAAGFEIQKSQIGFGLEISIKEYLETVSYMEFLYDMWNIEHVFLNEPLGKDGRYIGYAGYGF